jgi:sugar lactone lactonase YvrE
MTPQLLTSGLAFGEGPRWHDGRLWLSDMHRHVVLAIDPDGSTEEICHVPNWPSGLGWLPDGRLLVVSMTDRRVLCLDDGELRLHADLGALASWHCNDMVVDADGRAYVGNFGFDLFADPAEPRAAELCVVQPDGTASVEATGMEFPNGSVITPDGGTLIVAESFGRRLTAFTRRADGTLHDQRVWADLGDGVPDGICLDAEGAVWYADPLADEAVRVAEGGQVLDRVATDRGCYACMLGGPDRTTLYLLTAGATQPEEAARQLSGQVVSVPVDVAGAGWP